MYVPTRPPCCASNILYVALFLASTESAMSEGSTIAKYDRLVVVPCINSLLVSGYSESVISIHPVLVSFSNLSAVGSENVISEKSILILISPEYIAVVVIL